ncbi:MAG: hypothetical protein AAFY72_02975 [Cyanobacteria bacterium J06649_4]
MQTPEDFASLAPSIQQSSDEQQPSEQVSLTKQLSPNYLSASADASPASEHTVAKGSGKTASTLLPNSLRNNGLTTAAVASAGLVLPLVVDGALASSLPPLPTIPLPSVNAAEGNPSQTVSTAQGTGVDPQVDLVNTAAFSNSGASQSAAVQFATAQISTAQFATAQSSPAGASLLARNPDGSWTLAHGARPGGQSATQSGSETGRQTQLVAAQLAQETANTCSGSDCQRLAYINNKMPEAEQTVRNIQQQLDEFTAEHGQSNLPAYQKVLTDRIAEISKQESQLATDIAETRGYIGQLQARLSTVDADLALPGQLLAQSSKYQSTWSDLQQAERQLLEEFSRASIDATQLNQIYAVYQEHQQKLQRIAHSVLSNHLLDPNSEPPDIIYEAPAALDVMQALVIATHQEKVQLLRDATIDNIEQRLRLRQQTLARNISTYEQLQRDLESNQAIVRQYKAERDRINANVGGQRLAASQLPPEVALASTAEPSAVIQKASQLRQQLEEGTVAKALLGIVVAAGCIAAVTRRRKASRKAGVSVPVISQMPQPTASTAQMQSSNAPALQLAATLPVAQAEIPIHPAHNARRNSTWDDIAQDSRVQGSSAQDSNTQDSGNNLLAEMIALIDEKLPNSEPPIENLDLSIEIMARELNRALEESNAESCFAKEVAARNIEPVQLSLEDIDIFAEKAIHWVLQDLEESLPISEFHEDDELESAELGEVSASEVGKPSLANLQRSGTRFMSPRFATAKVGVR